MVIFLLVAFSESLYQISGLVIAQWAGKGKEVIILQEAFVALLTAFYEKFLICWANE